MKYSVNLTWKPIVSPDVVLTLFPMQPQGIGYNAGRLGSQDFSDNIYIVSFLSTQLTASKTLGHLNRN